MILLLEDKDDRAAALRDAAHRHTDSAVVRAATSREALREMATCDFDLLVLDHDLDHDGELKAAETGTGMDVVLALSQNPPSSARPPVIVSSKNLPAAGIMVAVLLAAGYPVAWVPYPHQSGAQMSAMEAALRGFLPRQECDSDYAD